MVSKSEFNGACMNGNLEIVQQYIDEGNDPSNNYNSAIRYASLYGHIEVVKLLLKDSRVDPSDFDSQAFIWACSSDKIDIVKLLLEWEGDGGGIDPSIFNNESIKQAYKSHCTRVVKELLKDYRVISKLTLEEYIKYIGKDFYLQPNILKKLEEESLIKNYKRVLEYQSDLLKELSEYFIVDLSKIVLEYVM